MSRDSVAVLRRLREQSARDAQHTGLTEPERAESSNEVAALDFAIAAIQSQQGATGGDGRYARHSILRQHAAQSVAKSGSGAILVSAAAVSDLFADLDAALAHPQAAGSVASGAVSGQFPAPIRNPEAWPERYADGYNDALQLVIDCGFATRPATAAGSAPVGVEGNVLAHAWYHWIAEENDYELFSEKDPRCEGCIPVIIVAATPAVSVGGAKDGAS